MKVDKIKLSAGYLLVQREDEEIETTSGLIMNENTDDFLIHAKVLTSGVDKYPVNSEVIFHVADCWSMRDVSREYFILRDKHIIGTYG